VITPSRVAFAAILGKDLRAELRTLQSLPAMALFAMTTFVIFRFALDRTSLSGDLASGVLWVTLLFAAILGINRLFVAEHEEGGFDAIRLAPIDRTALFAAKAAALLVYLLVLELVVVLLGVVLPAIYVCLTLGPRELINRFPIESQHLLVGLLMIALVLTISFWAATLAANTLRALLGGIISLASLLTCASVYGHSQTNGFSETGLSVLLLAIIVAALVRSFLLFRRPQPYCGVLLQCSLMLAIVAGLVLGIPIVLAIGALLVSGILRL
jgi:ABC-type transport system involved in cytochrome c biogenesis permease component